MKCDNPYCDGDGYIRRDPNPSGAAPPGFCLVHPREATNLDPPRGPLTPEVERAACTIHRDVWGESYKPGLGPMHFAGGPYWRGKLLELADEWERMAKAARVCAATLPGPESR